MEEDPISTITSPIYRDAAKTINETAFEVYVRGDYVPVLHYAYLRNPNLRPINMPDEFEERNFSLGKFTLSTIIDMLVGGYEFRFKYYSDVEKAAGFLKAYIDQCNAFGVAADPETKAFLEKVKFTYDTFNGRVTERREMTTKKGVESLRSIDEIVKYMACQL